MRISNGAAATRYSERAAARDRAARSESGQAAPVLNLVGTLDSISVLGIPESELTPKVRVALNHLVAEAQGLREQIERLQRRIGFLEELADRDPLAPVLNRRAFVAGLSRMLAFAERYRQPGSVLYFDIDNMKKINDSAGHAAGDAVLRKVAEILLREVRASDLVGRLGGDEFGVILPQTEPEAAAAKAGALARAIADEPAQLDGRPLPVAISYGIYTFAGGETVDDALAAADRAMYDRKGAVTGA
ncbi:MAG TPA: GGDEF domain-containing protein [Kiloniellales bacterium]|nr:GGDEF domain-containing protein [Kiloniellales bacterium]